MGFQTELRVPLGVNLSFWERSTSFSELVEIVRLADDLGFAHVTVSESFGRDGIVVADRLLAASSGIQVCFGVANPFSRSPAVLAAAAATLNDLSGGRFVLGLGASTANLVEGWHGLPFDRPLRRLRETVEMCHRVWARDDTLYEGQIFRAAGVKLAFEPQFGAVPIWSGSLLDSSLTLTGELFDGWMPGLMPVEHLAWARERIAQGSALAGRRRDAIVVAPTYSVCLEDEDAKQRERVAIATYYGPSASPYAAAASRVGFEDDVAAIQSAYAAGGARVAAAVVSKRLLNSVAIVGSIEECRDEIELRLVEAADRVSVMLPASSAADCEPILRRLVPRYGPST